jgi:hypothetical protein
MSESLSPRQIEARVRELVETPTPDPTMAIASLGEAGMAVLPHLLAPLRADHPIAATERIESVLKAVLAREFVGDPSGAVAREIAAFQKDLGFILKYKPYAVKASTILGYSVFLQEPAQGFSFQQHLTHKVELFHILDVLPGGYLFICDHDEWKAAYNPQSFQAWLAGAPDPNLDRFKCHPAPGDLYAIDRTGIVHSVIGCVLEEFATVSTDYVDRLHDQNASTAIPQHFSRVASEARLKAIEFPRELSRATIDGKGSSRRQGVVGTKVRGGRLFSLAAGVFSAARLAVESGASTELVHTAGEGLSIHVTRGAGRVVIADRNEAHRTSPPELPVTEGDLLLIPPRVWYAISGDAGTGMDVSIQGIQPSLAFQ